MVFVEFGANLLGGVVGDSKSYVQAAAGTANMAEHQRKDFEDFILEKFPPNSKRGTSGVFHRDFGDKIKAVIKDPSSADKSLRFFVRKTQLQLLDLPSLGARDVLVVPAKEQVCYQ